MLALPRWLLPAFTALACLPTLHAAEPVRQDAAEEGTGGTAHAELRQSAAGESVSACRECLGAAQRNVDC